MPSAKLVKCISASKTLCKSSRQNIYGLFFGSSSVFGLVYRWLYLCIVMLRHQLYEYLSFISMFLKHITIGFRNMPGFSLFSGLCFLCKNKLERSIKHLVIVVRELDVIVFDVVRCVVI